MKTEHEERKQKNESMKATFHISFDGLRLVGGVQANSNKQRQPKSANDTYETELH